MNSSQLRAATSSVPASTPVYVRLPDGTLIRLLYWRVEYTPLPEGKAIDRWPTELILEGRIQHAVPICEVSEVRNAPLHGAVEAVPDVSGGER